MIRKVLKEKAPRMYRELEKSRKLEEFLSQRDADMMEAYHQDRMMVTNRAAAAGERAKDWLRAMGDQKQALSQLTEQVLSTWLEFGDPWVRENSL